jgi:predicted DNA-binding protein
MAVSVVRMGRPPLKQQIRTRKTTIRLPEDLFQRIEAVAGQNRMAEFTREAIERELERRERAAKKVDKP